MRIVRQTTTELVVRDSSLWMSAVFVGAALFVSYFAIFQGDRRAIGAAGISPLIGIAWSRRSTFAFNAAAQRIEWRRLRFLTTGTGTIPF